MSSSQQDRTLGTKRGYTQYDELIQNTEKLFSKDADASALAGFRWRKLKELYDAAVDGGDEDNKDDEGVLKLCARLIDYSPKEEMDGIYVKSKAHYGLHNINARDIDRDARLETIQDYMNLQANDAGKNIDKFTFQKISNLDSDESIYWDHISNYADIRKEAILDNYAKTKLEKLKKWYDSVKSDSKQKKAKKVLVAAREACKNAKNAYDHVVKIPNMLPSVIETQKIALEDARDYLLKKFTKYSETYPDDTTDFKVKKLLPKEESGPIERQNSISTMSPQRKRDMMKRLQNDPDVGGLTGPLGKRQRSAGGSKDSSDDDSSDDDYDETQLIDDDNSSSSSSSKKKKKTKKKRK